jgi:hypothetical protein
MSADMNLIESLVADLAPVAPLRRRRYWGGIGLSAAASILMLVSWLGLRHDIPALSMSMVMMWKMAVTLLLGLTLSVIVLRASLPGQRIGGGVLAVLAAVLALFWLPGMMALMGGGEIMALLPSGKSCLLFVSLAALLPLAVFLVWLRRAAPVHPVRSGALAGCAAGAFGAFAFAWHCPHNEFQYVSVFYTLPGLWLAGVGAVAARILCRW